MDPLPPGTAILQVLPALGTGGVERGTVEMTDAIARAAAVALVASSGGRLVPAIERAGGRHIPMPLAGKQPGAIWRNARRLSRLLRAESVSVIHARSRAPAWSAFLAARRTGTPFVTTYHGAYSENLPGKRWYNGVMARGDRVIAISRHIAALVEQRHGIDPARIRTIPRGVDTAVFDPAAVSPDRMARLLRAWRIPDGAPVILLPARLSRWKGQSVLLDAVPRLDKKDVVVVLLGDGKPRFTRELERQAHRLGIADRVRLPGACDDMPAALRLASAAVSASTEPEAFGRAVIEAQAMGVPTIATDHGGAAETVDHLNTGWRVPPSDPDALAATLDHALSMSPADLHALGERARASVLAHYTTAAMQAATLDVYRELL